MKILLALLILISPNLKARCTTETKILVAGGVALGGYLFYKIAQSGFFDKFESAVINDAYSATQHAISLSEINILEEHLRISRLSESERRREIDNIKEGTLYQLNPAVCQHSSTAHYLNNINDIISKLKQSKSEVTYALRKENQRTYDLQNLLEKIRELLPKVEFLHSYVSRHAGYFNLLKITRKLDSEYNRELELVSSQRINYKEFKWLVRNMGCKIDAKYPFISYINKINTKIFELTSEINNVKYRYQNLICYAQNIKNKLTLICDNAISDEEYSKETREKENERIKQEQLALKEKEFELKQKMEREKLALQEREIQAREREAAAREQAIYLKQQEEMRNNRR